MPHLIPITAQQAQSYQMGQSAPQAAMQQPGASLQQTQQSTQTSGAEQAQIQASTPGAVAESGIKQVQQQQVNYPLELKDHLTNGMTLKGALSKYSSLMKPDDIFKQYLAQSPYGFPKESPAELQNMGVTPNALGAIGANGSYMDRWNTKSALEELRGLHDTWNQTSAIAHIPILGNADSSARAYNAYKQVVGEHLSSLVPGASNSQGSNEGFLGALPSIGDPFATGAATKQFSNIEQALMKQKGYNYEDLGIPAPKNSPQEQNKKQTGGDILTNLLANAGNDVKGDIAGIGSEAQRIMGASAKGGPNAGALQAGKDMIPGILNEYGDLISHPIQHATQHPVNTIMDVLPFLGAARGATAGEAAASAEATSADTALPKVGGNPLMNMINPKGQISRGGNFRDAVVTAADKSGAVISGDNLSTSIRSWADKAKLSNLPDADAIEQAAQTAEKQYAGKSFKPSEVQSIYNNIESGYTKGSVPKSAAASYIDRGVKSVLADQLNGATNNIWGKGTGEMAKGYAAQKSPVRKVGGRAIGLGMGIAGLDEIRHLLGL